MYIKIIEGLPQKTVTEAADPQKGVYKLTVKNSENGWGFWGPPSFYNYEIVGDKCVIDLDNPTQEGTAALAAHGVQDE